ncbi:Pycsar system effector family protein [Streptomyces sp. NPDC017979]|uniref:Pycsar system effector family protein n=1 Tax=Streptomyces sp. NPDC017979 TaxID=3365024 RepID=UPI003798C3DF
MSALYDAVGAAHAEVKAEIARTDTKTSLLLAFVGAGLAGVWTVAKDADLSLPALLVGGAGVGVLLVVIGLLLFAVRPNISGRHGFPLWATETAEEIAAELRTDTRCADIAGLSRLAVVKYRRLRRAVDLIAVAGGLLVAAAVLSFGGAA